MDKISDFEKNIIKEIEDRFKDNTMLPEYEELMLYLHSIWAYTGQCNIMYCNSFIQESIQLLKNALILYKNGFFDCAFYSIRQSSEIMNSMLYLAKSPSEKIREWKSKSYFPVDSKIKKQLEQISKDYKEIKNLLPKYFDYHEELIKKSHKIIHKQGFDSFYELRTPLNKNLTGYSQEKETMLFLDTLKYTIGKLLILIIVLDPMCLALTDKKVNCKVNANIMTEPIDINFFRNMLGMNDVVDKIMNSKYYQNFISCFDDREEMLPATYSVIREMFWNVDKLDEIEKQLHLLSIDEIFMFNILKRGIKVSIFYFAGGLGWYSTSNILSQYDFSIDTRDFDNYVKSKEPFNQKRKNVYVSVLKQSSKDFLFLEHYDLLSNEEINKLLELEQYHLEYLEKCNKEVDSILEL